MATTISIKPRKCTSVITHYISSRSYLHDYTQYEVITSQHNFSVATASNTNNFVIFCYTAIKRIISFSKSQWNWIHRHTRQMSIWKYIIINAKNSQVSNLATNWKAPSPSSDVQWKIMATKLHMMWYLNAIIHRFYNVLFTIDIKKQSANILHIFTRKIILAINLSTSYYFCFYYLPFNGECRFSSAESQCNRHVIQTRHQNKTKHITEKKNIALHQARVNATDTTWKQVQKTD